MVLLTGFFIRYNTEPIKQTNLSETMDNYIHVLNMTNVTIIDLSRVWEKRNKSETLELGDDDIEKFGLDVWLQIKLSCDKWAYKQRILVATM